MNELYVNVRVYNVRRLGVSSRKLVKNDSKNAKYFPHMYLHALTIRLELYRNIDCVGLSIWRNVEILILVINKKSTFFIRSFIVFY